MAEEQGSNKSKIILIIIIVLVIIAILLGVAFYFMTKSSSRNVANDVAQTQSVGAESVQTDAQYITVGPDYPLDQFIVNLLTQSGRKYLKVTFSLQLTNSELKNELNSKRAVVRNAIIEIISSKSYEQISTTRGKRKLREEITQRLNEFLVDGKVRDTLITDFAIQ